MKKTILTIAFLLLGTTSSFGDLFVGFSQDGGNTFVTEISGTVGSSVTFEAFLVETSPDTTVHNGDMFGFQLLATTDTDSFGEINTDEAHTFYNPLFDDELFSQSNLTKTSIHWDAFANSNVAMVDDRIQLGQIRVDLTGAGITTMAFGDFDPNNTGNWVTGDFQSLDSDTHQLFGPGNSSTNTFDIQIVSSVPEPTGLIPAIALGLFCVRRKRA